jgi:hypothetical protein
MRKETPVSERPKLNDVCTVCGEIYGNHIGLYNGEKVSLCPLGDGMPGIEFIQSE